MLDILSLIPGKKRKTTGGWYAFNGVCCHNRGHKPDKRGRAGIIFTGLDTWTYSCFNCHFKCGTSPGKQFTPNTKKLLEWSGVDKMQVERLSFKNFSDRSIADSLNDQQYKPIIVSFEDKRLPEGSELLDPTNPEHQVHIEYLASRGLTIDSYRYYVTPHAEGRDRDRIILPYYYNGQVVGNTSRFYDNRVPKYVSDQQRGFVFNTDNQPDHWQSCILVEGQFDAISIGGCAYLGSTISDEQARVIKKLRRDIIVVPDRDTAGMAICDRALELGYKVSIPNWSSEIKDVNDAVKHYGRLATTLSILQAATPSKITVEMKRKKFK